MLQRISQNISFNEAIATNTGLNNVPNAAQIANMQWLAETVFEPLRQRMGNMPIRINSFFRSLEVNKAVRGSITSRHLVGLAMDITMPNGTNGMLLEQASQLPVYDNIIAYVGDGIRWLHIDLAARGSIQRKRVRVFIQRNGIWVPS